MVADEGRNKKRDPVDFALNTFINIAGAIAAARLLSVGFAKLAEKNSKGVKGVDEGGIDWDGLVKVRFSVRAIFLVSLGGFDKLAVVFPILAQWDVSM